jgi:CMP-N-acetylneuraminic acid synthetase
MIALINARGGSKGIQCKNKKILIDKPLIQYTIETALKSKYISEIIISTDDHDIISIVELLGINVPFIRPDYLATDTSNQLDVIKYSIEYINTKKNVYNQNYILLQPTCPLRSEVDIDNAIEIFLNGNYDSVISVTEVGSRHPATCYYENNGILTSMFQDVQGVNRQNFQNIYWRNGSIYIFSESTIKNFNSIFGKNIGFIQMPEERSFNLDSNMDWNILESYLMSKKK